MKRIGFIGGYDKTDLILNIAKILTVLGNRVLVIDATVSQKARYVVPVINPTTMYVTEYEEIDIAVGFHHEDDIKKYLDFIDTNRYTDFIVHIDGEDWFTHEMFETCMIYAVMDKKDIGISFFDLAYKALIHSIEW